VTPLQRERLRDVTQATADQPPKSGRLRPRRDLHIDQPGAIQPSSTTISAADAARRLQVDNAPPAI